MTATPRAVAAHDQAQAHVMSNVDLLTESVAEALELEYDEPTAFCALKKALHETDDMDYLAVALAMVIMERAKSSMRTDHDG